MSEALISQLDSTGSPDDAVRAIAMDAELLAEVKAALPALQHVATAQAGTDGVKAVVGRRFALYPQPPRSEAEAAAWWAEYFDVLADVSLASLEAGMRAHVADPSSEFMPKPGRLRELSFTAPCRSLGRYYRAKRAIQLAEEKPQIVGPLVDPNDVRAMVEDFKGRIAADKPKPLRPSIAGKLAEGSSLTPEMHAALARRSA